MTAMSELPSLRTWPSQSTDEPPRIVLYRMPQQEEVRNAEDDWTGSTDAAERRKRQNRIHQRLYRKRRREQRLVHPKTSIDPTAPTSELSARDGTPRYYMNPLPDSVITSLLVSDIPLNTIVRSHIDEFHKTPHQIDGLVRELESSLITMYTTGSPRSDMLLTLIQFNVFRALVQNTFVAGFDFGWLDENAISHFHKKDRVWLCPPALQPTQLQRTVQHHPWIDIFPFPSLRDNLLAQGEDYDDSDLCFALVELCHAPSGRNGLIVWGESWDASGWEVTEEFATDWAWILRGCEDLLKSTNSWRRKRGEADLYFDVTPVEEVGQCPIRFK